MSTANESGTAADLIPVIDVDGADHAVTGDSSPIEAATETPPDDEPETSPDAETETPPEDESETPPEGEGKTPPEIETETPPDGGTETPPDDETEAPPEGETETPPDNETEIPPEGETETPPDAETETPPDDETETPPDDETETPPDDESEAPPEGETETPSDDESETPPDDEAETPPDDETETPPDETDVPPDGETETTPDDESETPPDGETETPPDGETESPPDETDAPPDGEAETPPKDESETPPDDESETPPDDETEIPPEPEDPRARNRIGIDANRPISPQTGRISAQVADPEVIASTGAGWVRLNFVLGPWHGPHDDTLHDGRTWKETYGQIISGFREKGLNVYGLIGVEAMPQGPGDRFREPPPRSRTEDAWLEQYVQHFLAIVEMFHQDVPIFESYNEPDDWHGQETNWVHPGWFAIILQRIYWAVRSKTELDEVKIVSGPLQGLETNRNAAVHYLQNTYRAGKARFGWGQSCIPYPFDGVGYHIYIKTNYRSDWKQQIRVMRTTCHRYLDAMHQVIRQEEGGDRPLFVSEVGWNSRVERRVIQQREEFQASCLRAGLETVSADPLVELGILFCTQDFSIPEGEMSFGLYRPGEPTPWTRKPAFEAFKALCEEMAEEQEAAEEEEKDTQYTNQQVINAFYRAGVQLGTRSPWKLLAKARLRMGELAANRRDLYEGAPIDELPRLTEAEKELVQAKLDEQVGRAAGASLEPPADAAPLTDEPSQVAGTGSDLSLDLLIGLQVQALEELERNNKLLEQVLEGLSSSEEGSGVDQIVQGVRKLLGDAL